MLQYRFFYHISFCTGGNDAYTQGLGQNQHIAGLGVTVGQHLFRVDEAGHRQTVDGLRAPDGVAAGDDGPGLVGRVVAAPEDL